MNKTDFGKGNITLIILRQAIPLIIAQLASLLYNIVDRIFIGHIPDIGKSSLTGLGICFPVITLISAFTLLFGMFTKEELTYIPGGRKLARFARR